MMKKLILGLLLLGVFAAPVQADELKKSVKEMNKDLKALAVSIAGISGEITDDDKLGDAISAANKAERWIKEVDKSIEEAEEAGAEVDKAFKGIVSRYPAIFDNLIDALGELEGMIKIANDKKFTGMAAKCTAMRKERDGLIQSALSKGSRDSSKVIESIAEDVADDAGKLLSDLERADAKLDRHHSAVKRFSGDKWWAKVTKALRKKAGMVRGDDWKEEAFGPAKKACEAIARGKRDKAVIAAADRAEDNSDAFTKLSEDVKTYLELSRELRSQDEKVVESMIDLICKTDLEPNERAVKSKVDSIIDKLARKVKKQYDSVVDLNEDLSDKVSDHEPKSKALEKLKNVLKSDMKALDNVKNGSPKGSNHPILRAKARYGVQKHSAMQRGCDLKEVALGSAGRLDCMSVKKCTIYEYKPSTYPKSKAYKQAMGYMKAFNAKPEKYLKKDKFEQLTKRCGGKIKKVDVRTYPACKS